MVNKIESRDKDLFDILARSNFLAGIQVAELSQLILNPARIAIRADSCIFQEGERAETLYLVESGQVLMQKAVVSKIRRISQNVTITSETRGSMNGLDSLIDPYLARFSACVERETRCIAFDAKPI